MHLLQTLQTDQLPIFPPLRHKLLMPPTLHHSPLVKHVNHVRPLYRAQSVRDRNGGASLCSGIESRLDNGFGFTVQRGRGFVKKED